MGIQHAVLALLADGPSHGYELKAEFDRAIGPQWGTLNVGQLYQALSRLSADGLVESQRTPQRNRPDRVVHSLTPRGAEELAGWLEQPTVRQHGYRDDFFLKLVAVSRSADAVAMRTLLDRQRDYLLGELRNLVMLGLDRDADPISALLVDAARLHVQADLALLDQAEETLITSSTTPAAAPTRVAAQRTRRRRTA